MNEEELKCEQAKFESVRKLQKQLNHPFYKNAERFREEIKMETLAKAAAKYPEPFNPASWTIEQLAKHAMAENYDQQNYIYGMYERLMQQEKEIATLKTEAEYWRLRAKKEAVEQHKGQFIDKKGF